jgi:hypothetical protein
VAEVNVELASTLGSVAVPQTHGPGEEGEADFGEFMAWIDGGVGEVLDVLSAFVALGPGVRCGVLPSGPRNVLSRAMSWVSPISGG